MLNHGDGDLRTNNRVIFTDVALVSGTSTTASPSFQRSGGSAAGRVHGVTTRGVGTRARRSSLARHSSAVPCHSGGGPAMGRLVLHRRVSSRGHAACRVGAFHRGRELGLSLSPLRATRPPPAGVAVDESAARVRLAPALLAADYHPMDAATAVAKTWLREHGVAVPDIDPWGVGQLNSVDGVADGLGLEALRKHWRLEEAHRGKRRGKASI